MADIADYGKGNYYYIKNSYDIPEIFASELNSVRNMIGQGTKMRIRFPDDYLSLNLVYGYPYEIEGNDVVIDFKDVFSGQNKSVLIKFDIKKRIDRKMEFESELSYEDVTSNLKQEKETMVSVLEPVSNRNEFEKGYDESVRQNIAVFEANEMMEDALKDADNGDYENARRRLQAGKDYMSEQMNSVAPSPEMRQQMDNMDKYGDELRSAETKTEEEKKEMQKSGKYDNYNSRKKQ
jgi:Ca-activated chloride channel homolog